MRHRRRPALSRQGARLLLGVAAVVAGIGGMVWATQGDDADRTVRARGAPGTTVTSSEPSAGSGPTVEITVQPAARADETLEVSVRVRKRRGGIINRLDVDFGDGRREREEIGEGSGIPCPVPKENWSPAASDPIDDTRTWRHAYRAPGPVHLTATVRTGYCSEDWESAEGALDLDIGVGGASSNGPLEVVVAHQLATPPPAVPVPGVGYVDATATDADGFIVRLEVDWGDGHRDVQDYPLAECTDSPAEWPQSTRKLRHRYAGTGPYAYSVTAVSVGCDGQDEQRATTSGAVEIGP
jgi:hypothetical protein